MYENTEYWGERVEMQISASEDPDLWDRRKVRPLKLAVIQRLQEQCARNLIGMKQ